MYVTLVYSLFCFWSSAIQFISKKLQRHCIKQRNSKVFATSFSGIPKRGQNIVILTLNLRQLFNQIKSFIILAV